VQEVRDQLPALEAAIARESARIDDLVRVAQRFEVLIQEEVPAMRRRADRLASEREDTLAEILEALEVLRRRLEAVEDAAAPVADA